MKYLCILYSLFKLFNGLAARQNKSYDYKIMKNYTNFFAHFCRGIICRCRAAFLIYSRNFPYLRVMLLVADCFMLLFFHWHGNIKVPVILVHSTIFVITSRLRWFLMYTNKDQTLLIKSI